ncbi:hypothetical protein MJH12_07060, partial [bacterium]|nr:hypothetical protein [bacterium]
MKLYLFLFCLFAFSHTHSNEFRVLNQGWNLVSLPIREDVAVDQYLSTHVTGSVSMIFTAEDDWLLYTESVAPEELSTYSQFDTFKPGFAYWLRMNESGKLYFNSLAPEVPSTTQAGLAPTYISINSSANSPIVSFHHVAEADAYNLYYHTEDERIIENGNRMSNVTSPFTLVLPNRDTKYFVVLTSLKDGVESAASEVMVINEIIQTPLPSPSIISHSSTTSTISIYLNNLTGIDQYNLYYSMDENFTTSNSNRITSNEEFVLIKGLLADTTYFVAASVIKEDKESALGNMISRLTKEASEQTPNSTDPVIPETSIPGTVYSSSEVVFKVDTGGAIHSNPMIGPDGTIYTGSMDGYL